jgi:hypothetical protein
MIISPRLRVNEWKRMKTFFFIISRSGRSLGRRFEGLGSRRARQSKAEQNKSNQGKMEEKQSTFVRWIIKRLVREAL